MFAAPPADVVGAFFCASFLLALAPGPDNIFVLTQAALRGPRAGAATTCGLMTGVCIQTFAVAAGAAAALKASPAAFTLLKIFGCLYLLRLAWLEWRGGGGEALGALQAGGGALYRRGVLMNVANPKVCLFFLAFLPQFCDPARGSVFGQIVFFGLLFMAAAAPVFFGISFFAGRLAERLKKNRRAEKALGRMAAIIYLALALGLAVAEI